MEHLPSRGLLLLVLFDEADLALENFTRVFLMYLILVVWLFDCRAKHTGLHLVVIDHRSRIILIDEIILI